jgi:outer membrane biosynthesis protein TonB
MPATPTRFIAALLFLLPVLGACSSSFDPTDFTDKLDIFNLNDEKKLKGERKPLFPEGVPGVSQGIPPDLVKGNKPPETAALSEEPPPAPPPEEKPKPKPRVVHRTPPKPKDEPKPATTRIQVSPAQQQQQPAWPDAKPQPQQAQQGAQSPWQDPQKQTSPWPDAPAPNTFQR